MSSLGLTPSEDATGDHRRHGALTKTGNAHARRALIEGAWAYRYPATGSRHRQWRLAKGPKAIQDISWQAPGRLCQRSRHRLARGKHAPRVVVASARALSAFLWAMAQQGPVTP
jgi:transposase